MRPGPSKFARPDCTTKTGCKMGTNPVSAVPWHVPRLPSQKLPTHTIDTASVSRYAMDLLTTGFDACL